MENIQQLLDQLRNGEIEKIDVEKEDFLAFRAQLVKDPQFKHFRGEAHQGGKISFTFLEIPRS